LTLVNSDPAADPKCECAICGKDSNFTLPTRLLDDCIHGNLVVFAGAGISTEWSAVYPHSLADDIADELNPPAPTSATFPTVMQMYTDQHSRTDLLMRIKHRLDYAESFPELRHIATMFHQELATIFPIQNIVTTNWDNYFEETCGALPIVVPEDYAFWSLPGRKVFKIHGSISNVGSIVATTADYDKCYRRLKTGIIGSTMQHLLATKSVVFVGYSLTDEDFSRIYRLLQRQLADFLPRSFIVTIDPRITDTTHPNTTIIRTSGVHFLTQLKESLVDAEVMLPDSKYALFARMRRRLREDVNLQQVYPPKDFPQVIYAASYQNGLMHACDRVLVGARTGEPSDSHNMAHMAYSYERLLKNAMRRRKYYDAAYIEGYVNGLTTLLLPDNEVRRMPYYFLFGVNEDIRTRKQFDRWIRRAPRLHQASLKAAEKIVGGLGEGLVVRHRPFLDGLDLDE
jgi:hypothetical protein